MATDYVYDGTSLPSGKSDARPPPRPSTQFVTAAEWNQVMQALDNLRAAILSGKYIGLASNPAAAVSPAGEVRIRNNAGALEVSEDGGAFAEVGSAAKTAAAGSATQAQAAADDAASARDAAMVAGDIYADTTAGLAATTSGQYFSVPSGSVDESLVLYKNATGSAVEVKRYPSADRVDRAMSGVVAQGEQGLYRETFQDNTPIVVSNLTDAATPTYTVTYDSDGMVIALSTGSRTFVFSTQNTVGGEAARIVHTAVLTSFSANAAVGLCFGTGADRVYYAFSTTGRITKGSGGGTVTGKAMGDIFTGLPTVAAGATITGTYDVDANGNITVTFDTGANSYKFTDSGVPQGAVGIVTNGVSTIKHAATFEAYSGIVSARLGDATVEIIDDADRRNLAALEGLLASMARVVPAGLTPPIPYDVKAYKIAGLRSFFTNVDLAPPLADSGSDVSVYYVDKDTGADTNAGTPAAPFKSISKAVEMPGSKVSVYVKPGLYDSAVCWDGVSSLADVLQVMPWGDGDVISSMHDAGLVWTLVSGSTYTAAATTVSEVFDASILTSDGDYTPLVSKTTQADVDANPGSYYVTGSTIYLHTQDGRAPDANIRVYKTGVNGSITKGGSTTYLERIEFHGGDSALRGRLADGTTTATIYAKNCDFNYSSTDGYDINGCFLSVLQGCVAAYNTQDGFNYHTIFSSGPPTTVEINCIGRWNGRDASGTNNGSTLHDPNAIAVRVGGDYHHNEARNLHDIGGSFSWNIGCTSRDSRTGSSNYCAGLSSETTLTKVWLDTCTSSGSTYDLEAPSGKGAIYTFDFVGDAVNVSGADVSTYQA